jgi:hypothetical protein
VTILVLAGIVWDVQAGKRDLQSSLIFPETFSISCRVFLRMSGVFFYLSFSSSNWILKTCQWTSL